MDDIFETVRKIRVDITKLLSKNTKRMCLYPGCSERSISSHSISKSILKNIAEDGHVISPVFNRCALGKNTQEWATPSGSNLKIKPIGIKDASIFNGFCEKHDNSVFCSLDDTGIVTYRDIFLQLYRSACRFNFMENVVAQSELKHQGFEYNCNTEFEEKIQINLSNLTLFFHDLLTNFDELKVPISISYSEALCQQPYSQTVPLKMETIYKKIAIQYPIALQKDFTLHFKGKYHHCLIVLLPHAECSSLIIACHPSIVPLFGNYISKGDIGILRLIESIMMADSDFYLAPSIYDKWSTEKKQSISDDFYFCNERKFLDEYDISIFDGIRVQILDHLSGPEKDAELQKLKRLPSRHSYVERDRQMTNYNIQQRLRKLKFTGNQTGRCYPASELEIEE